MSQTCKGRRTGRRGLPGLGAAGAALTLAILALLIPTPGGDSVGADRARARETSQLDHYVGALQEYSGQTQPRRAGSAGSLVDENLPRRARTLQSASA